MGACNALQKMLRDFFDQFQAASVVFAKFNLAPLQNYLILQQIFCSVRIQIRTCRSQIESNDIEKESAAKSTLITTPKNEEVLTALVTIRRPLQCEGADIDIFIC